MACHNSKLLGMEISPAFWHVVGPVFSSNTLFSKTISLSEILGCHDTFLCARDQVRHSYKINRQHYSIRILIPTFSGRNSRTRKMIRMLWRGYAVWVVAKLQLVVEMYLCAVKEVGNMATWAGVCAWDVTCDVGWVVHDVTYLLIAWTSKGCWVGGGDVVVWVGRRKWSNHMRRSLNCGTLVSICDVGSVAVSVSGGYEFCSRSCNR
jgi:hypothetical protein